MRQIPTGSFATGMQADDIKLLPPKWSGSVAGSLLIQGPVRQLVHHNDIGVLRGGRDPDVPTATLTASSSSFKPRAEAGGTDSNVMTGAEMLSL